MRSLFAAGLLATMAAPAPAQQPKVPDGTRVERNLEYGPHERNKLDLYVPTGDGPFPLVIWVHGGAWQSGSKEGGGPALFLLGRGYAVAAINYRLSQHAKFPAQIEDCQAAVRFLRASAKKYHLDPDHFGAMGASAGGHLVALMGTAGDAKEFAGSGKVKDGSSRVQCVVDLFGPTDLTRMQEQSHGRGAINHDAPTDPEAKLLGGPVQENKAKAAAANPITYVTKDDPPFLILHADKDPLVPLGQSELLHAALKKAGVESELVVIPGAAHGGKEFASEANRKKIEAFFDRHLKAK